MDELGGGQSTVTFTTGKMAKEHPDIVKRFLKAFAKGGETWDKAFLDAHGSRKDQASAPEMIDIVAQTLGEKPEVVARGIRYLTDTQNGEGLWDEQLYTGTGFPRVFYLRYHGYRKYFPLWALARYRNQIDGKASPTFGL